MTDALALLRKDMATAAEKWTEFGAHGRYLGIFAVALLVTITADDAPTVFLALIAGVAWSALSTLIGWLRTGVALETNALQVWAIELYNKLD